ncbi:(2Fe-2S)-binding protein [Sphingobium sp. TKS]|uniref:(2Fe-2S)-binding protein n=1 Tax=Sphingobium sp. TKS TaxID=1315974 RepID=UPI00077048F9|nr:(2Fe-2S)-binding protein [Sphingobium sp. TKS]AMK21911.1 2Fe-2S iron-sulfur cluster binding domain-containing protein [Sphingobium sp. TKS]AMK23454.1 2Fe-2S iron-sulfur cluster binding domain-containing protein [Sphingobium sp. TKS]
MRRAEEDQTLEVIATINGRERRFSVLPRLSLADTLREELGLYGVRTGCEHGVCGACTIIVDDLAVRSCLMLGVQADGKTIRTVESLAKGNTLHPLQEAFRRHHALQCGFCTAGILATTQALLAENPHPTRGEVRETLSGNICRCTGYQTIVDAIMDYAETGRPDIADGDRECAE